LIKVLLMNEFLQDFQYVLLPEEQTGVAVSAE